MKFLTLERQPFENRILCGDALATLRELPDESVHCVVTSPPYWQLRQYVDNRKDEVGSETTPEAYIAGLVEIFREVRRVLRKDGVFWLNLGDSFANATRTTWSNNAGAGKQGYYFDGSEERTSFRQPVGRDSVFKDKDKLLIPHRVAIALHEDGWWVRGDMPWVKGNSLPESTTDRPNVSHEYVFLLTKRARYLFDMDAVRKPLALETLPRSLRGMNVNKCTDGAGGQSAHSWSQPRPNVREAVEQEAAQLTLLGGVPNVTAFGACRANIEESEVVVRMPGRGPKHGAERTEKKAVAAWEERAEETGVTGSDGRGQRRVSGLDDMHAEEASARKMAGTLYGGDWQGLHRHSGYYDGDGTPRFSIEGRHWRTTDFLNDSIDDLIAESEARTAYLKSLKELGLHGTPEGEALFLRVNPQPLKEAHFAAYPQRLVEDLLKAGCPARVCAACGAPHVRVKEPTGFAPTCDCGAEVIGGIVLDPFMGSGTTGLVAKRLGRRYVGIELNPKYCEMAEKRIAAAVYQPSLDLEG